MTQNYIDSIHRQFNYYKSLGDLAFEQLDESHFFWKNSENDNSIAIIAKHIAGNMLSRWTNFYTEDGEKEWRNRDQEFINSFATKEEVTSYWERGWLCLFTIINALKPNDLDRIVYIRNQGHTVLEAINRQLCHYSFHIGQIVFISKMLLGNDWKNLSVPKGQSKVYNKEKFNKSKHRGHFTDDL
ncbi:MAG: DUF1572 family protein [Flavobacteriaceae bacterium]|nr:DUF1572 family protein [Flavobacteriaceae bacterium]